MEKAEESGVSPNPDHAQPAYAEPPWEGLQPQPQPASAQGFFSRSLGRASVAPPPTEAHPSTPTIRSRFVTLLSPKTQFRGWSRRRLFLLALLALCGILALALGLGLGLGLKKKSSYVLLYKSPPQHRIPVSPQSATDIEAANNIAAPPPPSPSHPTHPLSLET